MNINEHYMTWDEICGVVNRTKPTVWHWIQKGAFPKPKYRKIDGLLIGFNRKEIEHYCRTGDVL